MFKGQFTNDAFTSGDTAYIKNTFIDVLNKASSADWANITAQFPNLTASIENTHDALNRFNYFLGLNIGDTPRYMITEAFANKNFALLFGGIIIPVLAALTQWINTKLMPQPANDNKSNADDPTAQMQQSMKTMNIMMPIMSAIFCISLPAGMGLYWIAGSVVRSIQQVIINKHIDKIDLDAEIKKNVEKRNARLRKAGIDPEKLAQKATQSTKSVNYNYDSNKKTLSQKAMLNGKPIDEVTSDSVDYKNKNASKPGSLASKANMVREYNERNNK
jgi:YidC/Oxa1 family membrane protein insertase